MGDRVSIQFVERDAYWKKNAKDTSERSVALFNHWGGYDFVTVAQDYIRGLNEKSRGDDRISDPHTRREPSTIMVDFIMWCAENGHAGSLYLGKDETCGDNSDNGNFLVDVHTGRVARH